MTRNFTIIESHPADNQLFSGNSYTMNAAEFVCRDGYIGSDFMMKLKIMMMITMAFKIHSMTVQKE